jgi:hypothetical protein
MPRLKRYCTESLGAMREDDPVNPLTWSEELKLVAGFGGFKM